MKKFKMTLKNEEVEVLKQMAGNEFYQAQNLNEAFQLIFYIGLNEFKERTSDASKGRRKVFIEIYDKEIPELHDIASWYSLNSLQEVVDNCFSRGLFNIEKEMSKFKD